MILLASDQEVDCLRRADRRSHPGASSEEVVTRTRLTLVHEQETATQPQASRPR